MSEDILTVTFNVPVIVTEPSNLVDSVINIAMGDLVSVLKERLIDATPMGPQQSRILKSGKRSKAQPYIPGTSKKSWLAEVRNNEIVFINDTPYIQVLELGEYPGVGPRTEAYGDGIFSRQAVGGITSQIVNDQGMIDLIMGRIVSEIEKAFSEVVN